MEFEIKGKKYVLSEEDAEKFQILLTLISRLGYDRKYYIDGLLIENLLNRLKRLV